MRPTILKLTENQDDANKIRVERAARSPDPHALVANTYNAPTPHTIPAPQYNQQESYAPQQPLALQQSYEAAMVQPQSLDTMQDLLEASDWDCEAELNTTSLFIEIKKMPLTQAAMSMTSRRFPFNNLAVFV
ncbi:hypothetical protein Tco_0844019 [Tanacetum coccineum]